MSVDIKNRTHTRTDSEIEKDIVEQLQWDDRFDASQIRVAVDKGRVMLDGTVPSFRARNAAVDDVMSIPGVVQVDDRLSVKYLSTITVLNDDQIKDNVQTKLLIDPDIDDSQVIVTVDSGQVTIEGQANAYWKSMLAQQIASETTSVTEVVNNLAIVPTDEISDELIAKDITRSIGRSNIINPDDITIEVEDGEVALSGRVTSWYEWTNLLDTARYTAGVRSIADDIVVA